MYRCRHAALATPAARPACYLVNVGLIVAGGANGPGALTSVGTHSTDQGRSRTLIMLPGSASAPIHALHCSEFALEGPARPLLFAATATGLYMGEFSTRTGAPISWKRIHTDPGITAVSTAHVNGESEVAAGMRLDPPLASVAWTLVAGVLAQVW
jgi:hypothetical protein